MSLVFARIINLTQAVRQIDTFLSDCRPLYIGFSKLKRMFMTILGMRDIMYIPSVTLARARIVLAWSIFVYLANS